MALPPEARAPRKRVRRKSGTSSGGGGGPQGTGRITPRQAPVPRTGQKKRVKAPTKQQVKNAKAQQQGYVSQGRAVENVANQQRKVRLAKGQQAGYASQAQAVEREARKRTGRGAIMRQVKAELEGKGGLAKGLGKLGDLVERTAVLQSTGGGPGAAAAGVKLGGGRLSPGAATALAPKPIKVEGTAAGRALKDFVNLPATALPSLYEPTAGVVEAAQGKPERLKKIGKSIDEGDPVYNLGAALVESVQGNSKAAKKRLKQAESAASEHPGLTALEVTGAGRAVTGAAGRIGRTGVAGKTVKRVVSTDRADRAVPGTGLVERRDYHPDPLIKAAQVIGEKIHKPDRIPDREIRRRVDERVQITRDLGLPADATVAEFALRGRKSGKVRAFKTPEKAQREAGPDFTPVRLAELDRWTAIPKVAADRIEEHRTVGSSGGGIKTLQLANQQFRDVVLSTSPGWFAGNVIEGLGRAALAHAGPRSYVTGRRVLKRIREIDPAIADEAAARIVPGGYGAMSERVSIKPDFSGTDLAPVANALGRLWRAPGPRHAADAWHAYTHFVFRALNGRIESHIQSAMLGSALRKSNLMDGHLVKLSEKAIDQAAEGLRQTEEQVRFARKVRDMYGKYDSFAPGTRKAIATYTPFVAWYLNAIKFVTQVLPRDHPVVLALIAQAEIAQDEWLKDHGLGVFVKGALPGFLQGSIPMSGGRHFRASKFTPFGAFQSLPETTAGQVLPMWQSIAYALQGKAWTGREMRIDTPDGKTRPANDVEKAVAAAHAFLQGMIPGLSVGERIADKGPSALNPFNPTSSPKSKTKKIRKSSTPAGTIVGPGATDVFGRSSSSSSSSGSFFGGSSTSDDTTFFGN